MQLMLDPACFSEGVFDSNYKFVGMSVTEPRRTDMFELEFFTESGGVSYINGVPHKIRPGLFICAHPGDIRYTELPTRCHYIKLRQGMEAIEALLAPLPRFSHLHSTERCAELVGEMLTAGLAGDELTRMAHLLECIAILQAESRQNAMLNSIPQKRSREAVELAIAYMEEHFRDGCTLEEVAAYAHFSPIYFHKIFREAVGKTPFAYLNALRLEEAKRLLLTERTSMVKIADRCGYSSQSYFNYVFKKEVGVTPSTYRKQSIARYCV